MLDDLYGEGAADSLQDAAGADRLDQVDISTQWGDGTRVALSWDAGGKTAKFDCYRTVVWWQAINANTGQSLWGKGQGPGGLYKTLLLLKPWFRDRGVDYWYADPGGDEARKRLKRHRAWKETVGGLLELGLR